MSEHADDCLQLVGVWGARGPIRWILTEPDGRRTSGPVVGDRIVGGKYDGLSVRAE